MDKLRAQQEGALYVLTFNRADKHNAFDEELLSLLQQALDFAAQTPAIRAIVLKGEGADFSAGADLDWMQRMVALEEADNRADALRFAQILHTLYQSSKPTIALVQGKTYGGGIGLIAACDIAIASHSAQFCFSEVRLGLIPAVISPYVIQAIGQRATLALFLSAEVFDAQRAESLQLIHHCVSPEILISHGLDYAQRIAKLPPEAQCAAKSLVRHISGQAITPEVIAYTAERIAKIRVSAEAQHALHLFLKGAKE